MSAASDITIIGAGPYGLSIAAHLRGHGADHRIFGKAMHSWSATMPNGMLLKSPGFASNLHDPDRAFTLRQYCEEHRIPYEDIDFPIPLDLFCEYGAAFQKRFVPGLEEKYVVRLEQAPKGFAGELDSGESFETRKVVVAVGFNYFRYIPAELAHLPKKFVSHSGEHRDLAQFRGKDVLVLGSGASATDIAILLHENQANVHLISRQARIDFGNPWNESKSATSHAIPLPLPGLPISPIGPGLKSLACTRVPWLYRYLPDDMRARIVNTHLGPSGGWFMKERAKSLPVLLGFRIRDAAASGDRLQLQLTGPEASAVTLQADHMIAACGYQADVSRLPFLSKAILDRLDLIGTTPRLSANFESNIPGLYFAGAISGTSFGPIMRFVAGSGFAAKRIAKHIVRFDSLRERKREFAL